MDGATGHWRKRGKSVPASPFVSALMHACMHASPARTCGPVRARAPHHRPHHVTTHPGEDPPGQCRLGLLHSLIKLSCRPTTSSALRGRDDATHRWKPRRSPAVCCPIGRPNDPTTSRRAAATMAPRWKPRRSPGVCWPWPVGGPNPTTGRRPAGRRHLFVDTYAVHRVHYR